MAIKLGATGITFQDNSVQTTAGGPVTTQYAIGSYVMGRPLNSTNYNNDTLAGSSLYIWQPGGMISESSYMGGAGGSSAYLDLISVGSWRCVSRAYGDGSSKASPGLWVRYA